MGMMHSPIGMAVIAADGRFVEVNDALCRMLGRSAEQLLAATWQEIDIHIIRGVDHDPGRAAIAEMLVRFAERTGVAVVAEGVETEAEVQALQGLGRMLAQGYLFGRPEVPV